MVMKKVVPALTEVVRQDSATDLAGAEDDDFSYTLPPPPPPPPPPSPLGMIRVTSIIPHKGDFEVDEAQLCFSE
ncbi:unnamed protein product [Brassica rapa subsp. narinosa]